VHHVSTATASSSRGGEPESPVQPTSNPKDSPHTSTASSSNFKHESAGSLPTSLNLINSVNAAPTAYQMSRLSDDDTTTDDTTGDTANTDMSSSIAIVDSEEIASHPPPPQKTSTSHRGSFSLGSSTRKSISNGTAASGGLTIGPVALLREVM
jgi:hypothetical protein